ncbi:ABC transporter permease [Loktanella sp. IMCC34160]|uniref:ABC transporter permease n=1 Tax=Loktanella sp. IMCC34160 TaxID=2510646 RepID=UPI00101CA15B|nr:ABC transporter permease [Loktanella sp. IMCC34160]RYG89284.1 ABC transporter permease [Loktanella sp. IMCC34160]
MGIAKLKSNPVVWILLVAVLMAVILSFLSPFFMTVGNMTNLSKQVSIVAILAAGQAVVIISGGIDLSVGSVLAFSAVVIGTLIQMDVNPTLAMFAGLLAGTFAGWINGMVITRAKIPPFIATLGMLGIARGMALAITGGVSHPVLSPLFLYIGNAKLLGLPIPLYFVIVTFLVVGIMMHKTVFGRHVYAIGGNERVARLQGIPVDRQKVKIYALSGFLAALAAVVMTGRLAATPPSVAQAIELQAIAAVIIGGVSFVGGRGIVLTALIGALIMAMITNGLNILGISSFYQQVLIGVVIIVAVWLDNLKSSAR